MRGGTLARISPLLLLLASLLWGATFVAQAIGAEHVGAFTYLASRSWVGVAVLLPVIALLKKKGISSKRPTRRELLTGGVTTGFLLFAASAAQQIGIASTTAGKSGFITAMYVVLVPIVSVFLKRLPPKKIWISVLLTVAGMYLLCIKSDFTVGIGDLWTMLAAFLFSFQILAVSHYVRLADGVTLTCLEFFFEAIFASIMMLITERGTTVAEFRAALPAILFAGLFSSGVAYTLQTIADEHVSPPVASLLMCMESVFSVFFGWLILGEAMGQREAWGCVLMFAAILLSQLPVEDLFIKKRRQRDEDLA